MQIEWVKTGTRE